MKEEVFVDVVTPGWWLIQPRLDSPLDDQRKKPAAHRGEGEVVRHIQGSSDEVDAARSYAIGQRYQWKDRGHVAGKEGACEPACLGIVQRPD